MHAARVLVPSDIFGAHALIVARLCFRGIYFPMMGKLAWLKVVTQNRQTIFKLVKEAVFGRKSGPRNPDAQAVELQDSYAGEAVESV